MTLSNFHRQLATLPCPENKARFVAKKDTYEAFCTALGRSRCKCFGYVSWWASVRLNTHLKEHQDPKQIILLTGNNHAITFKPDLATGKHRLLSKFFEQKLGFSTIETAHTVISASGQTDFDIFSSLFQKISKEPAAVYIIGIQFQKSGMSDVNAHSFAVEFDPKSQQFALADISHPFAELVWTDLRTATEDAVSIADFVRTDAGSPSGSPSLKYVFAFKPVPILQQAIETPLSPAQMSADPGDR
ncbi:hypothetical protein EBR96_05100 [bacterium]|nr:hypothetical protein [bacterium]